MRMALEPGETFEHTHNGSSTTTLLEGSVDLIVGGTRTALVVGVPTVLAANVSHVLVNTGHEIAMLRCVHEVGKGPLT
jgi:quercetin dioxygenase-like cupin family protein